MNLTTLRRKFKALPPALTERSRRVWAASEALALGRGGIGLVERATGVSRSTVSRGIRELAPGEPLPVERTRRPGGGRKRTVDTGDRLAGDIDALHEVSYPVVRDRLHADKYSGQANRKTREGPRHPDRDARCWYLTEQVRHFQRQHRPAISVDTKQKELIGDFKNAGRGIARIERWDAMLTARLRAGLARIPLARVSSPPDARLVAGITTVSFNGQPGRALQNPLWERQIRVRAQGGSRGVRLSAHLHVSPADIDRVVEVTATMRRVG